jgi:hypothetical protein
MRRVNFKKNVLAVAVVMATGYMGSVAAHNIPLGGVYPASTTLASETAYDVYHTKCYTDSAMAGEGTLSPLPAARMRAQIAGISTAGTGLVKVTVGKSSAPGIGSQSSCTDNINGSTSATPYCNPTSPATTQNSAIVTQGNGDYDIVVNHPTTATSGARTYNVLFHCETSTGLHTGTSADGTPTGTDFLQIINY